MGLSCGTWDLLLQHMDSFAGFPPGSAGKESACNAGDLGWIPGLKPFPATAPQEKSHVRNWRPKGHLAPLMRPTKFPEIPV